MAKAIYHSRITAKKLKIDEDDIIEIDTMMDSSKQFEASNKHRSLFHHSAGCFYMEKMFGINFSALEDLRKKYNLPEEFIKDYQNQRKIDRVTGTELLSKLGKKFDVRTIAEEHVLQDFRGQFPTFSDFLSYMQVPMWANNGVKKVQSKDEEAIELANKIKENGRVNKEMERV